MNSKKAIFLATIGLAFGAITAFAVSIGGRAAVAPFYQPVRATSIDPVEDTFTRRIYFVNNDNWWTTDSLYVHAWQWSDGDNKTTSLVPATKLMDDVLYGLYYADVTFSGAGDRIGVLVTNKSAWDAENREQTVGVALPAIWTSTADVIYLNSGLSGGETGDRNASVGSLPSLTSGNLSYLLSQYKTCSDSTTDGYNAYPQVKKDFYPGERGDGDYAVKDYDYAEYVSAGNSYVGLEQKNNMTTIDEKMAALKANFDDSGYTVSNYHVPFEFNTTDVYTSTNGKATNIITYASVADESYKNVYSYLPDVPANATGIKLNFKNEGAENVQINVDVGTSSPSMVSHLIKTGEGESNAPYDWFDTSNNRGQYNIGAGQTRELTFLFDQSAGTIDGFLMFINSCWAETPITHTAGNMTISNAVFLF